MIGFLPKSLSKPFPFVERTKDQLLISLFFGLFVFVFLFVFEPFQLSEEHDNKYTLIPGYSIITFVNVYGVFFLGSKLLPQKYLDNWTIGKIIIPGLLTVMMVSVFNWIYAGIICHEIVEYYGLFNYILFSLEVGCMPSAFFIISAEHFLRRKNQKKAQQVTKNLKSDEESPQTSRIQIGPVNQILDLTLDQLLCIRSDGNYVEVFYTGEQGIVKEVLRHSLSRTFEQIKAHSGLKQCHRSYIVNFDKVEKVSGNARNLNLHLKGMDFLVPVSRNFPSTIIDNIKG